MLTNARKKNKQKNHHPDPINISEIVPNWKKNLED